MTRAELARLFERERAKFARGYPWVSRTALVVIDAYSPRARGGFRDLAVCEVTTPRRGPRSAVVVVVERLLRLERARIVGIVRHELGHAADPTPDWPGSEARADRIALQCTGAPIRYDIDDVQNTRRGQLVRPSYLHQ